MNSQTSHLPPAAQAPGFIKQVGFTLIELSIVLVIIGLIVGGVLVGQDLIKAAEIRATISQYEKYNAAINTFRTKYNAIPGDIASADAQAFGFTTYCSTAGTASCGDGDGLVESITANLQNGEPLLFWSHLSTANLIDGSLGAVANLPVAATTAVPNGTTVANYFPAAKNGRGTYWSVGSASGLNYYALAGISAITTGAAQTYAASISPVDAYNIDSKLDDGMPVTGTVQARGQATTGAIFAAMDSATNAPVTTASAAATNCAVGTAQASATTTSNTYDRGTLAGNALTCMLRLRFN